MEQFKFVKNKESLPSLIGIYAFKQGNSFLYIGKSINIKKRVFDHFKSKIFKDSIYNKKADKIGFIQTNSEIQALIKEAELIKRYKPKYNSVWKDSKNYSFVEITREKYPKIKVTHQKKEDN